MYNGEWAAGNAAPGQDCPCGSFHSPFDRVSGQVNDFYARGRFIDQRVHVQMRFRF